MNEKSVVDGVRDLLGGFSKTSPDPSELERLQNFLQRMKEAGVAKTREYNIPRPDTLGRAFVERPNSHSR